MAARAKVTKVNVRLKLLKHDSLNIEAIILGGVNVKVFNIDNFTY